MEKQIKGEGSTVIYGVPRVGYGTYDGCTPLPICLKAVANALGDEMDYNEIIATSGAGFRLVWDTACWNGGNVDVLLAYDDPKRCFENGVRALGRSCEMLWRQPGVTKQDFIDFIKCSIDAGRPIIATGIIGPPEACIVTGYRDNGATLLGWNFFQDNPEFGGNTTFDECGYFITDTWWEGADTRALIAIGEKTGAKPGLDVLARNAIDALEGRMEGSYAKGVMAYGAWKQAIGNDAAFPAGAVLPLLAERIMCHGDALDCLSDGRARVPQYLRALAAQAPEHAQTLTQAASAFDEVAAMAQAMFDQLGGWHRGEEQMRRLADPELRKAACGFIDRAEAADRQGLAAMKALVGE